MRYVVFGAGGIGGVVGARLFQAGIDCTLIARGDHCQAIRERGLRLVSTQGVETLPMSTADHPSQVTFTDDTVVLLCVKSQHTQRAVEDLAAVAPGARVVCMQNGVANERLVLRYFPQAYACVVILPAMFLKPGEVVTHAAGHGGILDIGKFPGSIDAVSEEVCRDLSSAGFSARPDAGIMRQKYAKLLANLYNVLQAGLRDFHNAGTVRAILREEALACFAAAGIDCATKAETQARRDGVFHMADIPGYERTAGSSWQSMARGTGDIETAYLNGEVCMLGRVHGVPTPGNDACLAMAWELLSAKRGPGILEAAELLARIESNRSN